jgi:hypothetical protein
MPAIACRGPPVQEETANTNDRSPGPPMGSDLAGTIDYSLPLAKERRGRLRVMRVSLVRAVQAESAAFVYG